MATTTKRFPKQFVTSNPNPKSFKVFSYAGNTPFCGEAEIWAAMGYVNTDAIRSYWVRPEVAALIICHCCGFQIDAVVGGEYIAEVK